MQDMGVNQTSKQRWEVRSWTFKSEVQEEVCTKYINLGGITTYRIFRALRIDQVASAGGTGGEEHKVKDQAGWHEVRGQGAGAKPAKMDEKGQPEWNEECACSFSGSQGRQFSTVQEKNSFFFPSFTFYYSNSQTLLTPDVRVFHTTQS